MFFDNTEIALTLVGC